MIQTPLTVWSWWLADFPNVVRTSFPSAFSPSPAPAKQHNNAPSCPFHLFPFPIPALPHSFEDYPPYNSPLCLSLTWWTQAYTPYSVPPHPCTDTQAPPRFPLHSTRVWCCTWDSLPHRNLGQWFSFSFLFFFSPSFVYLLPLIHDSSVPFLQWSWMLPC